MRVLLIKMSSLGDVVHALAGVTDAARAVPQITFDWVVEEAYREIPQWHSTVRKVIPSPLRRWRKSPVQTVFSGEWKVFREELRRERYDLVLDAQGLLKSAVVGRQAHGPLTGRTADSAREPAAALLYNKRVKVDLALSEVEQLRHLFAGAIGYQHAGTAADFGIDRTQFVSSRRGPYAMFLHGAAWKSKLWAEENWIELGKRIRAAGVEVLLPWDSEEERNRAERIAAAVDGEVLDQMEIASLATFLSNARFVIGLDTGLTHIAIALGTPTVTLYGPSVPVYDQVAGGKLVNLCSTDSRKVDTARPNRVAVSSVADAILPWLTPT